MNLPKLNPKESLMDRSVVENYIRREGKRERGVIFPLYLFHTVSYVCLFLDSISKDSIVSSTISFFPYHSAHQPLALPIWFHNDRNFQHSLVWGKKSLWTLNWLDNKPALRTIRKSLSQSNSMATTSRQHKEEWQCQRGWKIQRALSLSLSLSM